MAAVTVMAITAALAVPASNRPAAAGLPPDFSQVAPILQGHCVPCHAPGGTAPGLSLMSYEGARHLAASIKAQVISRAMPPWPADPEKSMKFRNDARLDRHDVDTLAAWVDGGAPPGSGTLPPPKDARKWLHPTGRPPDAVLTLPDVSVAAAGEIPYVQQRVKVPLAKDAWIVAMQVRPGNDALVHHMGITEVAVADGVTPEDLDALAKVAWQLGVPDDAFTHATPAVMDPQNEGAYDMLGVYTPGSAFELFANDSAKLLRAGKNLYINFNIHYTATGRLEHNHSELGLWFQPQPPAHQLFRAPAAVATLIANGRELLSDDPGTKAEGTDAVIPPIAPYEANYQLIGLKAYAEPITIYQLQPHAHMRAKDFTYTVVYPDGREATILTVPKYDFHWQLAYDLEMPLTLPAGSKLIVTAHYDNSRRNKHLTAPGVDRRNCGPDKQAYFRRQNQSWHEMFSPLIQYSIDIAETVHPALPLVEAVGCLERDASLRWMLTKASSPVATRTQSTSSTALRAAAATPPGGRTYGLLGTYPFAPEDHGGKYAVKGIMIDDAGGSRVNVTSLQRIAAQCP